MTETGIEYKSYPYAKSVGISLLLHGVLIVCLTLLGSPDAADKPAEIPAIEVDIVPATVIAAIKTAPPVPAEFPQPSANKRPDSRLASVATRTELFAPALPGETSDIAVVKAVSTGPGVIEQTASAAQTGGQTSTGEGDGDNHESGVRTPPAYLYGSKPVYPQAARKAGWEGAVVVRALINTDGSVASAAVKESSGYDILDEAAVQAVKKWRYSPAKKGGVPIASPHDIKVRFRLDEAD